MTNLPLGLQKFADIHVIENEDGYIIWRVGTGDNIEITHIRSFRKDGGTRLLKAMLVELKKDPPHISVFGFTRINNEKAHQFYVKVGFSLSRVEGVYEENECIVFSATYKSLCEKHLL